MTDITDRTSKNRSLTAFAERVISRWQETPVTSTMQRAVPLSDSRLNTPITRATATREFVQRITQPKTNVGVWAPGATTRQTTMEVFADALIQRFPDISAKYVTHTEESAPSGQPDLIYPGSSSGTSANPSDIESLAVESASVESSNSETFDVNKLPSVPAEVMARHKAALQRRVESSATPTNSAPRPVQRKGTPPNPPLIRPRSKVEYFGRKTEPAISDASASALEPLPASSEPTSPTLIQAKAEDPIIPESTPLEEPRWRTRPRAGFQSIPTRSIEGDKSPAIPYQPIQVSRTTPHDSSERLIESTAAFSQSSDTGKTAIQRVIHDSTSGTADEGDDNDHFLPRHTTLPGGPAQPPSPLPQGTPLQRTNAPETSSAELQLREKPSISLPMESGTESLSESTFPSLSMGIPAKAIRRTSQTPPILRKPILPSAVNPQTSGIVDASTPLATPRTAPTDNTLTFPALETRIGSGSPTSVQTQIVPPDPIQVSTGVEQEYGLESLYETQEIRVSADAGASPVTPTLLNTDASIQRKGEGEPTVRYTAEPNLPNPIVSEREILSLRAIESSTEAPVLPQVPDNDPTGGSLTNVVNAINLPDEGPFPSSLSAATIHSAPRADIPTVAPLLDVMWPKVDSATPATSASIQRKEVDTQPGASSLPPVPVDTGTGTPHNESSAVSPPRETPAIEHVAAKRHKSDGTVSARIEMPLRTVEDPSAPTTGVPVQLQEDEGKVDSSSIERTASSVPTPADHISAGHPDQGVVLDSGIQTESSAPVGSEAKQEVASSSTVVSVTSPVQRIVAESSTPEIPNREDMPLHVEETTRPLQRKSDYNPPTTSEIDLSPARDASPLPVNTIASSFSTTTAASAISGPELQSVVLNRDLPFPEGNQSAEMPTEPTQRVTAETTISTAPVPTQANMPLRLEKPPADVLAQEWAEVDGAANTSTTSGMGKAPTIHSVVSPNSDMGDAEIRHVSQTQSPAIQYKVDNVLPAEPEQRGLPEVSQPDTSLPTVINMPLRRENIHGGPPVQRQPATEMRDESSFSVDVSSPSLRQGAEANRPSPSLDTPRLMPPSHPLVQQVADEGSHTDPRNDENTNASPPSVQQVPDEGSKTFQVRGTTPPGQSGYVPPSMPALPHVSALQRVRADIGPPPSALPIQADLDLWVEPSEVIASPAVQRETVEGTPAPSLSGESSFEEHKARTTSQPPVQRVVDGESNTHSFTGATSFEKGENSLPFQPLVQRGKGDRGQAPTLRDATPSGEHGYTLPTVPTLPKVEETLQLATQSVHTEISTRAPVLPTRADMPLRVEASDASDPSTLQRVVEENHPAQPQSDTLREYGGNTLASRVPEPVAGKDYSSEIARTETHEVSHSQPVIQEVADKGIPSQPSNFEPLSGEIAHNSPPLPAQTDMPLQVPTSNVTNTPPLQRVVDDERASFFGAGVIETHSTGDIKSPTIQRKPQSSGDEQVDLGMTSTAAPVESTKPAEGLPNLLVSAGITPPPANLPPSADMPLRNTFQSPSVTIAASEEETAISTGVPLPRVSSEGSPSQVNQDRQAQNLPSTLAVPVVPPAVTNVTAIQTASLHPSAVDTPLFSQDEPPVQRVGASVAIPPLPVPRTADILLRDAASPLQRHEELLETRENPAEPSGSLPIEPSTHQEYRSTSALQSSIPTLPPAPTDPPVQLIVKGSEKSTLTPASLVQRKATVKAAQIRRKTTPIMESGSMVVAPIQRLVSTTARVANPIPGSLPFPSSSIETDEVERVFEAEIVLPLQRMVKRESLPQPLPRVSAAPVANSAYSASDSPVHGNRYAPTTTAQKAAPSTLREPADMPLVQRVETTETVVQPEEQQEVNIDLTDYFNDTNNASGNGSTAPAKVFGGPEEKAPTESDALKALQTLADEIYPLLRQMIARERERHRGF